MAFLEDKNRFYQIDASGNLIAEIVFTTDSQTNSLIVERTFVDPNYRGQGLAKQLVDLVVLKARQEHKHIIPLCGYVRKVLNESSEYQDVLK